jgi:hypothetical protein
MLRLHSFVVLVALCALGSVATLAQTPSPSEADTVRVNVTINPDESRTVYEFDSAKHKAIGTTTEPDGKLRGRIEYKLDDAGRFASGQVFGPEGQFRFKTLYKYDPNGRLEEEVQRAADDSLLARIVYGYDASGKQNSVSIFDASGKLIGGTPRPTPVTKPSAKPHKIGR